MKSYFLIHPAQFRLDGGAMFGIIPKPLWEKLAPPDQQNRIDMSLRMLVIKTDTKVVVIDSGIGDYHDEKFNQRFDVRGESSPLSQLFKQHLNLDLSQVTDVILSHLHFDHAGGLGTNDGEHHHLPLFPKATLHLHRKHYEYGLHPTERDAGSFLQKYFVPLIDYYEKANQIHWLEGEIGDIISELGLKFITSHGHTPYLVHPFDERFIYMADLVPTHAHVRVPWVMAYDMNPGLSTQDKRRFYQLINEQNLTMIFEHDPQYWGGKPLPQGKDFVAGELQSAGFDKVLPIFLLP